MAAKFDDPSITTKVLSSAPVDQVGDEPPEAIEQREKNGGEGAGGDDDHRRIRDFAFRGPTHFGELGGDFVGPGADVGTAVGVDGGGDADDAADERGEGRPLV